MSVFVPYVRNYAPFYVQRESDQLAVDIRQTFGVTVKVHEYPVRRKAKQPYKIEWLDRDGDREHTPKVWYESFPLHLSCVLMADEGDSASAREAVSSSAYALREMLRQGPLHIYDSWTRNGFRDVRLEEFPEVRSGDFSEKAGKCRLIFDVVLRVNDPSTPVRFENGVISDVITPYGELAVLAAEHGPYVVTENGKLVLI